MYLFQVLVKRNETRKLMLTQPSELEKWLIIGEVLHKQLFKPIIFESGILAGYSGKKPMSVFTLSLFNFKKFEKKKACIVFFKSNFMIWCASFMIRMWYRWNGKKKVTLSLPAPGKYWHSILQSDYESVRSSITFYLIIRPV